MKRLLFGMIVLSALGACDWITAPCTTEMRAGITLTIVDSTTQAPVGAQYVRVRVMDGTFVDTASFSNTGADPVTGVGLAFEREGNYDLEVTATGYQTWTRNDVHVDGGRCHVETANVTALMQRIIG